MKCPKCGYLGFEYVDRCRNCGYDFSLAAPLPSVELPLKREPERVRALEDLSLVDTGAAVPQPSPLRQRRRPNCPCSGPIATTAPHHQASPPRQPLAVRRATPEVPRLRTPPKPASLDLRFEQAPGATPPPGAQDLARAATGVDAPLGARLLAASVDLLILAAVDLAVVYFTLQVCGIGLREVRLVPKAPLAAFLLVQNLGYLVAFTAGGQTLGKMAAGIKVVSERVPRSSLDVAHALVRELAWLVLVAPAGLGFLTAFPRRDHRGLHDRFAGTRVVRG